MKKLFCFIFVLLIVGFGGYYIYINYLVDNSIIVEKQFVSISDYYIYGDHLNMNGFLQIDDMSYRDVYLTLYNGEDRDIEIVSKNDGNKLEFYFSEYINDGFYLDNLVRGKYYLFLKLIYDNKDDEKNPIIKYYALDNSTKYDETVYYTMSKYNNKIVINSNNEYNTMMFNIKENRDKEIYDVTIDPGHGGMDSGGVNGDYYESDFTMTISKKVKENLEAGGLKVKLTHNEGEYSKNDIFDEYNDHGRAVIPNEVKSKYTFSIHLNKNVAKSVRGIEVYTPVNINYDFVKTIVNNLVEYTDLGYSSNMLYKMFNGIYSHNFTEYEVENSLKGYEDKGYVPYNVSTKSNYYYMIRETGGYMTGAYINDSNSEKVGVNPYYDSNVGNEAYLLELGYLSNSADLSIIKNSTDEIAKAISDAIIDKFDK